MSDRKAELNTLIYRGLKVWDMLKPEEQQYIKELQAEVAELEMREQTEKREKAEETSIRVKRSQWRGKYGERRLAKRVRGVVVGRSKAVKVSESTAEDGVTSAVHYIQIDCQKPPDVVTEMFSFESKWLKSMPKFLDKVMGQAIRNCPTGLTPIAVIGDREQRVVFYIMTEKDFLELHI